MRGCGGGGHVLSGAGRAGKVRSGAERSGAGEAAAALEEEPRGLRAGAGAGAGAGRQLPTCARGPYAPGGSLLRAAQPRPVRSAGMRTPLALLLLLLAARSWGPVSAARGGWGGSAGPGAALRAGGARGKVGAAGLCRGAGWPARRGLRSAPARGIPASRHGLGHGGAKRERVGRC